MNPTFRLIAFSVSAGICGLVAYLAMTHQIGGIEDLFSDQKAVQVVKEEEKKPPPPPPPPPKTPPPPPPPITQREPPIQLPLPPMEQPIPQQKETPPDPEPVREPPRPPAPPQITAAAFDRLPDGRAFARFYPERALERTRGGRVTVRCNVNASGALVNCVVVNEDPEGWGFGEASLRITREFRVKPQTADGTPTDGGQITFPIRWNPG